MNIKVKEVLDLVKKLKPSAYDDSVLIAFLNDVESMVWVEVLHNDPTEYVPITTSTADKERELTIVKPYDTCYVSYVQARIDHQLEELTTYANDMQMFNAQWDAYIKYIQRHEIEEHDHNIRNFW